MRLLLLTAVSSLLTIISFPEAASALVPELSWSSAPALFGNRSTMSCAVTNRLNSYNDTISIIYTFGGYSRDGYYNDVYGVEADENYYMSLLVKNGEGPDIVGSVMFTFNSGRVILLGESPSTAIFSSTDGQIWEVTTAAAPWQPRADILATSIPFTNTAIIVAGVQDNRTFVSRDGAAAYWTTSGQMPLDSLDTAAVVAVNPTRNANGSGIVVVIGGYVVNNQYDGPSNFVYLSADLGVSWKQYQAVFSPRRYLTAATDNDNNIYMTYVFSNSEPDYSVWFSNDYGLSWGAIALATSSGQFWIDAGCFGVAYYGNEPTLFFLGGVFNDSQYTYNGVSVAYIQFDTHTTTSPLVPAIRLDKHNVAHQ